jgi:PAS domain S-box-containing protein
MRSKDKTPFIIVSAALVLGLLVGLRLQAMLESTNAERAALDFRLAATQRTALVREAFLIPSLRVEVLRRFFENSDAVDENEYRSFIAPWLQDSSATIYSVYLLEGETRLVPVHGKLEGAAEHRAEELVMRLSIDGKPQSLVMESAETDDASILMAAVAKSKQGLSLVIFAQMYFDKCIESAIGATDLCGLPICVFDRSVPPRLLSFHPPKLDASLGAPLTAPEKKPAYSFTEPVVVAGTSLDIRVDASPKYREQRNRNLYVVVAPTTMLIFLSMALGINALRRRAAIAEAGRNVATAELERFFSVNLDLLCIWDSAGTILTLNPAWEGVLGYPLETLVGMNILDLIHEEDVPVARSFLEMLSRGDPVRGFVDRLHTKSGDYKKIEWRAAAAEGLVYAAARDVTERELNEARLKRALDEKETLLREVHHRVKNNLQIVSSVLNLHEDEANDPRLSLIIERAQNRIRSMALVHETLYRSQDFSGVDFQDYAKTLIADYGAGAGEKSMQVTLDTDPLLLDLDLAIHCGLLLNELATNAAKHAVPSSAIPSLKIALRESEGELLLAVEDNGPGLPQDFDIVRSAHLGLRIAATLASQLAGSASALKALPAVSLCGARFEVRFRPPARSFRRCEVAPQLLDS